MTIVMNHVTRINGAGSSAPKMVLNDVSMAFPEGLTMGILSVRGMGKSSLIRVLAGVLPTTYGQVLRRGLVSFPIGSFGWMHRHMSGRENMRFIARIYNLEPRPIVDFVGDVSGLGPSYDQPVASYSGEKRARLAFSASYAIPFDIYLADEFMIGGPPPFRDLCRTLVRERQRNATFILATRSPALVRLFCDNAAVLHEGQITQYASVRDAVSEHARLVEAHLDSTPDETPTPDPGFWSEETTHAA